MIPVPTTKDELLIAALRHANETSTLLNDIHAEVSRLLGDRADDQAYDRLHDLMRKRLDGTGLALFIAADNLRLDLPADLRDQQDEAAE